MRARLLCLVSVRLGRVMAVPASLLVMLFWAPQLQAQLVITNNSPMPNGAVGVFYYQVLTTNNPATSGFTWSVIKGTLPPGLDLNPFGGALTGSPTAAGPYSFTIQVTYSISTGLPTEVATKDFVLTVISLTVTAVIPEFVIRGGPSFTLTVEGTGFVPFDIECAGSEIRWNGTPLATVFNSPTRLQAIVSPSLITKVGSVTVDVLNLNQCGTDATSNSMVFRVLNPVATISSISPTSQAMGAAGFTLTVIGSNFVDGAVVRWNGADRATRFVNSTMVTAIIPASDLAAAGTAGVTVINPAAPDQSNVALFSITNPIPNISSIAPQAVQINGAAFTLTVNGANFINGSQVLWNGNSHQTTFVSSTQLTAKILASDLTAPGSVSVSVSNPSPGGGTSNSVAFAVDPTQVVIGTSPSLPAGFVGMAYSQPLSAQGGVTPYTWSFAGGSLPGWLALDSTSGILSGTPTAEGSFSFTVQVRDSFRQVTSRTFSLLVHPLPSQFTIAGVSDNLPPAQQSSVSVTIASPYGLSISGQLQLTVTSDTDDPAIQFATGGRSVDFTILAGSTDAVFPGNTAEIGFQTGTVSSTIKFSITVQAAGTNLPLSPDPTKTASVEPSAPGITSVSTASCSTAATGDSFDVVIIGYSNTRAVNRVEFSLTARPGVNLQTSSISIDVSDAFRTWYQSEESRTFGSQFKLVVHFSVSPPSGSIASISAVLTNDVGPSPSATISAVCGASVTAGLAQ